MTLRTDAVTELLPVVAVGLWRLPVLIAAAAAGPWFVLVVVLLVVTR